MNPEKEYIKLHSEIEKFFSDDFMIDLEAILQNSVFSSKMLLNLVNDLLDLAKMEQNTF